MADISRRKESESHWNGVDLTSDISLSLQEQEKEAAVEEEEEEANLGSDDDDGSDYEDDSNSSQSVQTSSGNDIILSLRDANYKSIMFSFFRQLGTRQYLDEVSDEEKRVKEEVFNIFQSSGGRLMRHRDGRRPKEGLFEVDEKTARESKCDCDLSVFLGVSFVTKVLRFYLLLQKLWRILAGGWNQNLIGLKEKVRQRNNLPLRKFLARKGLTTEQQ